MAAEIGTAAVAVEEQLLAHGERFSYFQAVRLLRLLGNARGISPDTLRVRPKLGLGFPENDIEQIETLPEGGYRITANFFGLYGVASPLPTYYTEDLFAEEREGRHATRDFLDVIHYAMYPLLFEVWRKHRLLDRVVEDADTGILNQLYAFTGLHDPELRGQLPEAAGLLRYAGLFNLRPRSAMGLRTLLADAFAPARVEVESCTHQNLPIPTDQRLRLGMQAHCLGETTVLGSQIDDRSGSLTLHLGDLPQSLFHALLPGTAGHERLKFLTRFYVVDPLEIKVELELRHEDARAARTAPMGMTGAPTLWSRLGLDTWLTPECGRESTSVQFIL